MLSGMMTLKCMNYGINLVYPNHLVSACVVLIVIKDSTHSTFVDVPAIQQSIVRHVTTTLARTHFNMDDFAGYQATANR